MAHEGAGLEQVGAAPAEPVDIESGAAACKRKAGDRRRREAIVKADGGAVDAAGGVVGAESSIAVGGLRATVAGRPHVPALFEIRQRRLAIDRGKGVACALVTRTLASRG